MTEDNVPFFGFKMTTRQRLTHSVLMWFVCVFALVLDLSKNYGPNYEINDWLFFPPLIISYILLYNILPWNKERTGFNIKYSIWNLGVYLAMTFLAISSASVIFAICLASFL